MEDIKELLTEAFELHRTRYGGFPPRTKFLNMSDTDVKQYIVDLKTYIKEQDSDSEEAELWKEQWEADEHW